MMNVTNASWSVRSAIRVNWNANPDEKRTNRGKWSWKGKYRLKSRIDNVSKPVLACFCSTKNDICIIRLYYYIIINRSNIYISNNAYAYKAKKTKKTSSESKGCRVCYLLQEIERGIIYRATAIYRWPAKMVYAPCRCALNKHNEKKSIIWR